MPQHHDEQLLAFLQRCKKKREKSKERTGSRKKIYFKGEFEKVVYKIRLQESMIYSKSGLLAVLVMLWQENFWTSSFRLKKWWQKFTVLVNYSIDFIQNLKQCRKCKNLFRITSIIMRDSSVQTGFGPCIYTRSHTSYDAPLGDDI